VPDSISYRLDGGIARIAFDDGKANAMSVPWFEALGVWMALIAENAIPYFRRTEALLHARAYTPAHALSAGIVHAVAADAESAVSEAVARLAPLGALNRRAYAETKKRMRAEAIDRALAALKQEQGG
jgi:enoyl-CoA hydratase/carnithine racemase